MPTARSRTARSRTARSRTARTGAVGALTAAVLAALVLLAVACGDGAAPAPRERDGGTAASGAELADVELALAELDARIARLEATLAELTVLAGGDVTLLADLPGLVEDLRLRSALIDAAFRRLDALEATTGEDAEDPCDIIGIPYCPENPLRDPADEQ